MRTVKIWGQQYEKEELWMEGKLDAEVEEAGNILLDMKLYQNPYHNPPPHIEAILPKYVADYAHNNYGFAQGFGVGLTMQLRKDIRDTLTNDVYRLYDPVKAMDNLVDAELDDLPAGWWPALDNYHEDWNQEVIDQTGMPALYYLKKIWIAKNTQIPPRPYYLMTQVKDLFLEQIYERYGRLGKMADFPGTGHKLIATCDMGFSTFLNGYPYMNCLNFMRSVVCLHPRTTMLTLILMPKFQTNYYEVMEEYTKRVKTLVMYTSTLRTKQDYDQYFAYMKLQRHFVTPKHTIVLMSTNQKAKAYIEATFKPRRVIMASMDMAMQATKGKDQFGNRSILPISELYKSNLVNTYKNGLF